MVKIAKDTASLMLNSLSGHCYTAVAPTKLNPYVTEYSQYYDVLGIKASSKIYVVRDDKGRASFIKIWYPPTEEPFEPSVSYDYAVVSEKPTTLGQPGYQKKYTEYTVISAELNEISRILVTEDDGRTS